VGFVVDKVALGQVFSEYFGYRCQFSFHQMFHTPPSSGAGTVGLLVADVPSGFDTSKMPERIILGFRKTSGIYPDAWAL
jgi:hypothetical protein